MDFCERLICSYNKWNYQLKKYSRVFGLLVVVAGREVSSALHGVIRSVPSVRGFGKLFRRPSKSVFNGDLPP